MSSGRYRRAEELEGAQRAAAEAEGNVVVAAGAGSGKTTVLAARYVRLIETGRMGSGARVGCRNILVLTFTRKAAAEMYARIYGALSEAAALASDPELAAHLASCISDFSQAQISTFDSFAARIARSASARYGVAPDFSVDEERVRASAGDLALSFILERREDEAIRELVSALGLERVRDDVLAELAVSRMSISSPPDFASFHAAQAPRLEAMESRSREALLGERAMILEYAGARTTDTSRRWLDAVAEEPGDDDASFAAFAESLAGLRKPGSNAKDDLSRHLSGAADRIRKEAAAYRSLFATKAAHPARLGLYRLLDDFRSRWDETRRREGILSFNDVARLALDILESDEETRSHYQGLYRYAMIDEFQDDNELQKRLLFLVAGDGSGQRDGAPSPDPNGSPTAGRSSAPPDPNGSPTAGGLAKDKLFFVGDEKQSIYLFRGADVSVFRRLPAELGTEAIPLSRNFRSEPGVIDAINAIFPSVMAPVDPEAGPRAYEARFEALGSRAPTPGVTPRLVYLELPRAARRAEDGRDGPRDPAESEAWEVARVVRDAVGSGSLLVADRGSGRARPARYEDFAILLRSTGKQVHFEKYLRLLGVPYASENACGLFSEAVACDLYYALRLSIYPSDLNALAAFLRSPFAGLSDEAIVRLVLASRDAGLDPLGPEVRDLLPEEDRGPHARGAETVARLSGRVDREGLAASLSYLWFEAGYRAALLRDPVASAFEEHFELLHSMAVAADRRRACLAAFVTELEGMVGKPDKLEVDLPRDSARGVRIMTVHKSKGLEFPIVVLPQAGNVGRDRSGQQAWFWDDEIGPTFKPPADLGLKSRNAFFDHARERLEAMEAAEIKRLLYVALTRAESQVIVTAVEPRNEDSKGRSFRSLLGRALGLFDPPSPLASDEDPASPEERGDGTVELPPFGRLSPLPSGAFVGIIPERGDAEYYALVGGVPSGEATGPRVPAPAPVVIDRRVAPLRVSVTERAEEAARGSVPEEGRVLDVDPSLAPPASLAPTTWGSLVHEALEALLSGRDRPRRPYPSPGLRDRLEEALGGAPAADKAAARARDLATVFARSELGARAAASSERHVETAVAIALEPEPMAPRWARGVIDLAFIEGGRVVVVDYKTDLVMRPRGHALQLGAYARAAEAIFGLPSEAWLFYLYGGGRAVRLDELGEVPSLEAVNPLRQGDTSEPFPIDSNRNGGY